MLTVGVREFKDKTSEYIKKAKSEGSVIVTNHGKPVAAVVPLEPDEVEDFLLAHSKKIQAMVKKGIKDVEAGRVYSVDKLLKEAEDDLGD